MEKECEKNSPHINENVYSDCHQVWYQQPEEENI
jgi:hypothetical protein